MVPLFIIGGTLITFGMIVATGIGILANAMKRPRDAVLVARSVEMSATATFMPPQAIETIAPLCASFSPWDSHGHDNGIRAQSHHAQR